jgi:ubiquinol-cytochrome c reductase cytochrome b subunit
LGVSRKVIPSSFTPPYQIAFWRLIVVFVILTWLGACPIEEPYLRLSVPITILYFLLYLILVATPSIWAKFIRLEKSN